MAVTIETSFAVGTSDMGQSHEDAYDKTKNEDGTTHPFLQDGEQKTERLIGDRDASVLDLALAKAHEQGLKNEREWREYNSGLRKSRQKDSYEEYVAGVTGKMIKGKQRVLDSERTPASKKAQLATELAKIKANKNVPLDGELFYLSNVDDYENNKDNLKNYRLFEDDAFHDFEADPETKKLNPGAFISEVHNDELGTKHDQKYSVWFRETARGTMEYSKKAIIKDLLVDRFGSEDELNRRIDLLCDASHETADHIKEVGQKEGTQTTRSRYHEKLDAGTEPKGVYKQAERDSRMVELWRNEQLDILAKHAEKQAALHNVLWEDSTTYTTDGVHRSAAGYREDRKNKKQANDAGSLAVRVHAKKISVDNREVAVTKRETAVADANASLVRRSADLDDREDDVKQREVAADRRDADLKQREAEVSKREREDSSFRDSLNELAEVMGFSSENKATLVSRMIKAIQLIKQNIIRKNFRRREAQANESALIRPQTAEKDHKKQNDDGLEL